MKIDDVTLLLSNRINQPHYVKDWLEKIYKKGFEDSKKQNPYTESDMKAVSETFDSGYENFETWLEKYNEPF
ncbi:MAG: hypothetical protein KKD36_09895 [Bacteroidetes bacterium]|nr:hypothetical protein [Bacteroidota bacterium]